MKRQAGFTLVEMMIGITVGIVVLIAAGIVYVDTLQANVAGTRQQRFEQTLLVLTGSMVAEIRRAGYAKPGVTLTTAAPHYQATGSCVVYSNSTPDHDEVFHGWQLSGNAVYYYTSTAAAGDCGGLTGWTQVTDPTQVKVEALSFTGSPLVDINVVAEAVGLTVPDGSVPLKRQMTVSVLRRNS